jgi:hypothetical protein
MYVCGDHAVEHPMYPSKVTPWFWTLKPKSAESVTRLGKAFLDWSLGYLMAYKLGRQFDRRNRLTLLRAEYRGKEVVREEMGQFALDYMLAGKP